MPPTFVSMITTVAYGSILLNRMYGFQSLDQLKETFPELNDIRTLARRRLPLEIFLKRALVCEFKKHIEFISMDVATIKLYNIIRVPHALKAICFL